MDRHPPEALLPARRVCGSPTNTKTTRRRRSPQLRLRQGLKIASQAPVFTKLHCSECDWYKYVREVSALSLLGNVTCQQRSASQNAHPAARLERSKRAEIPATWWLHEQGPDRFGECSVSFGNIAGVVLGGHGRIVTCPHSDLHRGESQILAVCAHELA